MKIWLVQMKSELNDKQANLDKILSYMGKAAKAGVDLVALPELCLTGYVCRDKFYDHAEPIPGPATDKIAEAAARGNMYVVFGMPELKGTIIYNSAVFIGPEGVIGVYRKLYLCTICFAGISYEEGMYFKEGFDIPVFDTKFGKIGLEICYDIWFSEIVRAHALRGARLVLNITACPDDVPEAFQVLARTRAMENETWFGFVNQVGHQDGVGFRGGSCMVDYKGNILKTASMTEQGTEDIVDIEIDIDAVNRHRIELPLLRDVRPEILQRVADISKDLYFPPKQ